MGKIIIARIHKNRLKFMVWEIKKLMNFIKLSEELISQKILFMKATTKINLASEDWLDLTAHIKLDILWIICQSLRAIDSIFIFVFKFIYIKYFKL